MVGYNPGCDNCFKCMTCRGNGYVDELRYENKQERTKRITCRDCGGKGGKPGAGEHNHS